MASNQTGRLHGSVPGSPYVRPANKGIYDPSFRLMNTIEIRGKPTDGQRYKTFSINNLDNNNEEMFIVNYSPNSHHGMTLEIKKDQFSNAIAHISIAFKTSTWPCAKIFDDSMDYLGVVENKSSRSFQVFTHTNVFTDKQSGAKKIDPSFTLEIPLLSIFSKNKYQVKGRNSKNKMVDVATIEVDKQYKRVILAIVTPQQDKNARNLDEREKTLLLGLVFILSAKLGAVGMSEDDFDKANRQPETYGALTSPTLPPQDIEGRFLTQ